MNQSPSDFEELDGLTEDGFDELVELAVFCLATNIPYKEAREFPDVLRAAFIEAHNELHPKQS